MVRPAQYPPAMPWMMPSPAPTIVNLNGDSRPEILYDAYDGFISCTSPDNTLLWRKDIRHNRALMYGSDIVVADLNRDNVPELILTTFGDPENLTPDLAHGYLMVLGSTGNTLFELVLPE